MGEHLYNLHNGFARKFTITFMGKNLFSRIYETKMNVLTVIRFSQMTKWMSINSFFGFDVFWLDFKTLHKILHARRAPAKNFPWSIEAWKIHTRKNSLNASLSACQSTLYQTKARAVPTNTEMGKHRLCVPFFEKIRHFWCFFRPKKPKNGYFI